MRGLGPEAPQGRTQFRANETNTASRQKPGVNSGSEYRQRTAQVPASVRDALQDAMEIGIVPVGPYPADQPLVSMAVSGGRRFRSMAPTRHCRTNIEVIRAFLDVGIDCREEDRNQWRIDVTGDPIAPADRP